MKRAEVSLQPPDHLLRGVADLLLTGVNYRHAEAFCLMKYAARDGSEVEWVWNSRDGVAPFIINSRSGRELYHVQWDLDRRLPGYRPCRSERVFVDLTPALARQRAVASVEREWERGDAPLRLEYETKEQAVEAFVTAWLRQPGQPALVEAGSVEGINLAD